MPNIGQTLADQAKQLAQKEQEHVEDLYRAHKMTVLVGLGALLLGVLLGLAL